MPEPLLPSDLYQGISARYVYQNGVLVSVGYIVSVIEKVQTVQIMLFCEVCDAAGEVHDEFEVSGFVGAYDYSFGLGYVASGAYAPNQTTKFDSQAFFDSGKETGGTLVVTMLTDENRSWCIVYGDDWRTWLEAGCDVGAYP